MKLTDKEVLTLAVQMAAGSIASGRKTNGKKEIERAIGEIREVASNSGLFPKVKKDRKKL